MAGTQEPKEETKGEKLKVEIGDPRRSFCDRAFVMSNDEHFVLAFQSGSIIESQFAFTPKHAKRFLMRLQEKIEKWEKDNGKLEVSLPKEE